MSDENSIQEEEDSSTNEETYNLSDLKKEIHEIYKIVTAQTNENSKITNKYNKREQQEFCDDVFTIEERRKLIQLVQPHKKIYNQNAKKYKGNRELWKRISRELGGKCHLGTKIEWQRLKSKYFREAIRSEDPEYKIRFELYEDLVFLEPYIKHRNQKNPIKKKREHKKSSSPQPCSSSRRSSSQVKNETKEEKNCDENEDNEDQEIKETNNGNNDNIPRSSDSQVEIITKKLKKGKAKEKKVRKSVENENKQEEFVQDVNNIKETHNNEAIAQDINNLKETISSLTGLIKNLSDNVSEMKAERNDISEFISRQSSKKY